MCPVVGMARDKEIKHKSCKEISNGKSNYHAKKKLMKAAITGGKKKQFTFFPGKTSKID